MDPVTRFSVLFGGLALMGVMVLLLRWTFGTGRNQPGPRIPDPDDPTGDGLLTEVSRVPTEPAAALLRRRLREAGIRATVARDGEVIFSGIGGHSNGDPLLPAIALAKELRTGPGILPGQIVTTGTYSGLRYVPAGSTVTVSFKGFGQVEVAFER